MIVLPVVIFWYVARTRLERFMRGAIIGEDGIMSKHLLRPGGVGVDRPPDRRAAPVVSKVGAALRAVPFVP